jgi:tRNA A37 methylthiotransferase MiaB
MTILRKKKVLIYNIGGCERRGLDTSRLIHYFKLNGCKITVDPKSADYIILITCSFINLMEDLSLKLAKIFARYKGQLVLLGCLPGCSPNKMKEQVKCKSLSTKNLYSIDNFFPNFKIKFSEVSDANFIHSNSILTTLFLFIRDMKFSRKFIVSCMHGMKNLLKIYKNRAQTTYMMEKEAIIRISGGCLGNCSYCGIKNAIGTLKSKPLKKILDEYKKLLNKGYTSFLMVGEDTGAYGLDIHSSFSELLKELTKVDKNFNTSWFIRDLNPQWIVRYKQSIFEWIKLKKIKYIEVNIQSGSKRILKLMNRYRKTTILLKSLQEIKKINPQVIVITQIIIGFPTETEKDVNETLNFIKKSGISSVIIFN